MEDFDLVVYSYKNMHTENIVNFPLRIENPGFLNTTDFSVGSSLLNNFYRLAII